MSAPGRWTETCKPSLFCDPVEARESHGWKPFADSQSDTLSRGVSMGQREERFVNGYYEQYSGRVAIGVGYAPGMVEIFPFVLEDRHGKALGIVAMAALSNERTTSVHIFHISAFEQKKGDGSRMMRNLCREADRSQVALSLSPIPVANGRDRRISGSRLLTWYRQFGFAGDALLVRQPERPATAAVSPMED
jgi:GNAT superfamily N-acetyltransferase